MLRKTLTYKYAVFSGIIIAICMALTAANITPDTVEWTYYIWLPVIYLFLPVMATCWIWIFILDLIYKKPFCEKSSNNKFLIAIEFILIAIFLYGSYGTFVNALLGATLTEGLIVFLVYMAFGGVLAALIKFIIRKISSKTPPEA